MARADNNTIMITNIIPKSGPGMAGMAIKRTDKRIWVEFDGIQRPMNHDYVKETTADNTLVGRESGCKIEVNAAATTTITLPAAAVGLEFLVFVKQVPGSGAGVTIAPAGTEKVYAKGITAGAGKGLINTQATGAIGDAVRIWSDGTDWFAILTGTWARVA